MDDETRRYLGDLGLLGTKYSADAASSAALGAAQIGADASRYNAGLDYDLGVYGWDTQRYGMDQGQQRWLAEMLAKYGPEAVFGQLFGNGGSTPGPVLVS
jgi:hypothetical protein